MVECSYIIKKEINGVTHEVKLDRSEISAIWAYYDDVIHEELIVNKLINDYGVKDINKFKSIIDDLMHRYNKSRGYGCDEEHSLEFAFDEMSKEIDDLLTA